MGGQAPGGLARNIQVSQQQTKSNLSGTAQPEMRAREGFQQQGAAFERLMQDRALQQRIATEQRRRSQSPFR